MSSRYDEIMKTRPQHLPFRMGYLTEEMVVKAEKELDETPQNKTRCIASLRTMVEEEENLDCPLDDSYLIQYLRARKYNVRNAFSLMQNYYHVKKSYYELYEEPDRAIEGFRKCIKDRLMSYFPYRDEEGCPVLLLQMSRWNPDEINFKTVMQSLTGILLFAVEDPATQVCGLHVILDVRGACLKQIRCFTPRYMHLFSKALRNCLQVRFKEKIKKRVHFHGDNQKHLHKFVPKAILPSEYGGDNTQHSTSDWFANEIERFYDQFKKLHEYGYTQ